MLLFWFKRNLLACRLTHFRQELAQPSSPAVDYEVKPLWSRGEDHEGPRISVKKLDQVELSRSEMTSFIAGESCSHQVAHFIMQHSGTCGTDFVGCGCGICPKTYHGCARLHFKNYDPEVLTVRAWLDYRCWQSEPGWVTGSYVVVL